ncbi:MAG: FAD:protein FMN transferase [Clostridiales bacterium]|jgi:thiamine biosynthesis lipoprotein|nr:FAD:protein FMN transferase [Clostridiales bacterium]
MKHKYQNYFYLPLLCSMLITTLLLIVLLFTGCSNFNTNNANTSDQPAYITKSSFLLDTFVTIQIYDKQEEAILEGSMDVIRKYEKIYSRTDEDSELYQLNHGALASKGQQVSEELADLLKYSMKYSNLSEGAFDLSIAPVSSLWNFKASNPVLPSEESIKEALSYVNYKDIKIEGNKITFAKEGMAIDLGAIAKGYIADRVKDYLLGEGVKSAMINLGGNVLCVGNKPDGSPFNVGIQMPYADRNETIAVMEISDLSVVSSGIYERYFSLDGVSYHHILNPKTGYPYDSNLISVTIISPYSVDGDGLSTSAFALGLEKGMDLIESIPNTYAIFITDDYKLHYTKGFKEAIKVIVSK